MPSLNDLRPIQPRSLRDVSSVVAAMEDGGIPVPQCQGCKHWERPPGEVDGVCSLLTAGQAVMLAESPDEELWAEEVWTFPTFGCIGWQSKDDAE